MGIITLVSGGIDSIVMAKIIEKEGEEIIPIFIDYGQLSAEKEWLACKTLFQKCELPEVIKVNLAGYGKLLPSGLTDEKKDIKGDAFLPGRNMLFLLVGSAYANHKGEKTVAIGLLSEDLHLFPDQTMESVVNTNIAVNSALGDNIVIITPLINFSKVQIVILAKHYRVPLEKTYSCHSGSDEYCGNCIACKEILDSGVDDEFPQFGRGD